MQIDKSWLHLSKNPDHNPPNQIVHSGDAFKDPAFEVSSQGLKLSNSNPGRRVSALHFFRETDTTDGFLASSSFI